MKTFMVEYFMPGSSTKTVTPVYAGNKEQAYSNLKRQLGINIILSSVKEA